MFKPGKQIVPDLFTSKVQDDTDRDPTAPRPRPDKASERALPDHLKKRIATRRALKGGK